MKIIPFFIPHEGCTNQCVFCNQHRVSGAEHPPTSEEIAKRIDDWTAFAPGAWEVAFFGGSFSALPEEKMRYFLSPAKAALDRGLISEIRISTRPDAVNRRVCDLLSEYGVTTVELGVQSTDRDVLRKSGRYYILDDVHEAVACLRSMRMCVGVQIMPGLPGDTLESMEKTVEELVALGPDIARIYPTLVIADTPLYEMYRRGEYTPLSLEDAIMISLWSKSRFELAGARVIRVGLLLNATRPAAGPYHCSFHTLVKSALFRRMAVCLLMQNTCGGGTFVVSPQSRDSLAGYKKENVRFLSKEFDIHNMSVDEDSNIHPASLVLKRDNSLPKLVVTHKDITSQSLKTFLGQRLNIASQKYQ